MEKRQMAKAGMEKKIGIKQLHATYRLSVLPEHPLWSHWDLGTGFFLHFPISFSLSVPRPSATGRQHPTGMGVPSRGGRSPSLRGALAWPQPCRKDELGKAICQSSREKRACRGQHEARADSGLGQAWERGKKPQKHIPMERAGQLERSSNPSPCPPPALSIFSFIQGGPAWEWVGKSKHLIQGKSRRHRPSLRHIGPAQVSGTHHVALGSRLMPGLIAAPGRDADGPPGCRGCRDPLPQS